MNTSFVVILNLLIIYLIAISWADETTKEPQLFSFEKLGKLTQLVSVIRLLQFTQLSLNFFSSDT